MLNFLLVAVGGAAGASLRYGVSVLAPFRADAGWPVATLCVSPIGGHLVGALGIRLVMARRVFA
jgi:CrcB protein